MKAVILAGGLGTRLRPITYTIPKPLMPIVGKPLVARVIDALPASVDTVILAISYMRDAVADCFRVTDMGRKIIIVNETTPLGTGGALKNVAEHLDSTFIAMNGDCLSSIDLKALVKTHREQGGIGTIALWEVDDPSAYGVVAMDPSMRIQEFQEKPPKGEAKSHLINAGYYVFEPDILDYIGKGPVSIEREVFPVVLDVGLFGSRFDGYWVDCGTRESILRAQHLLLDRGEASVTETRTEEAHIIQPNHLKGVTLKSCRVGPYVCAAPGVVVNQHAEVSNSLLMQNAIIEEGAVVMNSLVGPNTRIGKGERVVDTIVGVK
jgi:mannose-1-phosphate guanylyltransferase